jgi:hypothetical protein
VKYQVFDLIDSIIDFLNQRHVIGHEVVGDFIKDMIGSFLKCPWITVAGIPGCIDGFKGRIVMRHNVIYTEECIQFIHCDIPIIAGFIDVHVVKDNI